MKKQFKIITILLISSILLMSFSFLFTKSDIDSEMIYSYYESIDILVLNILPIVVLILLIYSITDNLSIPVLVLSIIIFLLGITNTNKFIYRSEPVYFNDIKLLSEGIKMGLEYDIVIHKPQVLGFIGLIIFSILIFFATKKYKNSIRTRLIYFLFSLSLFIPTYHITLDTSIYKTIGDYDLINRWIETEQHQTKGLIYPFLYSYNSYRSKPPVGYDESIVIHSLDQYKYKDMEEKPHIISIMLEAYNDFTQFPEVELNPITYEKFHLLKEESITGNLITNVFAGGTINTERSFLNGGYSQPNYNRVRSSYVWYLKEQGYYTLACHPMTGSFYNRRNQNPNLGFDEFWYMENKFNEDYPDDSSLRDHALYPYLIEGYEKSLSMSKPYFNFTVTYQNHGPYPDDEWTDIEFIERQDSVDEKLYNIVNNYFLGIWDAGEQLYEFIDYFRDEKEPVIIVVFGDHNPWLGENASGYEMLNINMDINTVEGFKNYYSTPYLIWANNSAKDLYNKDFVGENGDISPHFLFSEVFQILGEGGSAYNQYLTDLKINLPVIHKEFYKENGKYTKELNTENKEKLKEFRYINYYELNRKIISVQD